MRISTQNIACSQRQMNTCHTSFSYILWAYGVHIMSKWSSRTSDQFIWVVSEKKTEAVNAYLIKNSKGEGAVGGGGGGKGGRWLGGGGGGVGKGSLVKMFERSKWYIWMGFGLTFWKLNRSWTGDGTIVTYAQVRYTDLGDYGWVICI